MKALKYVLIGIAIAGIITVLATASFAEKEHSKADIKLLKDSAAALQQSHPDLAKGLIDYANREEMAEPKTESLNGNLENVDLKNQEIVVDGVVAKITENTLMKAENERGQMLNITPNTITSYVGKTVKCYVTKTGPKEFTVTKLKVYIGS